MTVPETSRSVETLLYCPQVVFLTLDFHCTMDISARVKAFLEWKRAEGSSQRAANDSNTC